MTDSGFDRACPRCNHLYFAKTERGICPACQLFSRVAIDGRPIAVICTYDAVELDDWPYEVVDEPFGLVLQALAAGGGPVYVSERHEGYPKLSIVHEQLSDRFEELRRSVERSVPDCSFLEAPDKLAELASLSAEYGTAERLVALSWIDEQSRCDVVGCWTSEGGSVDVVRNLNAVWYHR